MSRMRPTLVLVAVLALIAISSVQAQPVPQESGTLFDRIFNIPISVLHSVNHNLNAKGQRCPDGSFPVQRDGVPSCHDANFNIPITALRSVNDLLNG